MKIKVFALSLLTLLAGSSQSHADEGMWLMQQLKSKYALLKQKGLKMKEYDLYNPNGTSLKDAVVIFDRGCTGEIISSQGLVLTNHHCGYDAIQSLSSVEHNYLQDGYWSQSLEEELPAKDVTITFIDKIEDVTDFVLGELRKKNDPTSMDYLSPRYLNSLLEKKLGDSYRNRAKGIEMEIKAFYNGNKYLLFTKKIYSDIRFVGAPPSSIGKFGADTDNWAYPRHAGDFSIFRIYADANGNPAPYSPNNIPLKPKRWFNISTQGVEENKFAMIMGFPGRTNHFYLPSEVKEWKEIDNDIRIRMRGIRQEVMLKQMLADPKTNIMYAAKYASSQNGYKRAIGANWGIEKRHLDTEKARQMQSLLSWAQSKEDKSYSQAVEQINKTIDLRRDLRRQLWYLNEGILYGIEFAKIPLPKQFPLSQSPDPAQQIEQIRKQFPLFFDKDYSPTVDRLIAQALLTEYTKQIPSQNQPQSLREGIAKSGSVESYVNTLFSKSVFASTEAFNALMKQPLPEQIKVLDADPMLLFARDVHQLSVKLKKELAPFDNPIDLARRTYVAGLINQHGADNLWPDANSTLRFTFGNVKGYSPRDGSYSLPQTFLRGVIEKEDPNSWEFQVAPRLKEIYERKSYGKNGRWAVKDGKTLRMPVDFIATTHTTGGNSGSPVFDASGNLIGINFDRTWEGVGGDIQYLPEYQRSIICDIRYILMIIDEYGGCSRLINELSFR